MKIGVVKERAPNERRVALVPEALKPLLSAGAEVLIERGAGDGAALPDRLYEAAGMRIEHSQYVLHMHVPESAL